MIGRARVSGAYLEKIMFKESLSDYLFLTQNRTLKIGKTSPTIENFVDSLN